MAETLSIRDRIAALNIGQVGRTPSSIPSKPPPPPPPARSRSTDAPQTQSRVSSAGIQPIGNQPIGNEDLAPPVRPEPKKRPPPVLPPRPSIHRPAEQRPSRPSLPPRTPSREPPLRDLSRRGSAESVSSTLSSYSATSGQSLSRTTTAPASRTPSIDSQGSRLRVPTFDPATLPPLPPKKTEPPKRPPLSAAYSAPKLPHRQHTEPKTSRASSVALPTGSIISRTATPEPPQAVQVQSEPARIAPQTNGSFQAPPKPSALSWGLNKATEVPPVIPQRPAAAQPAQEAPPIPLNSRPKPNGSASSSCYAQASPQAGCLKCRDFSGPDNHAARFPRQSIPSTDVGWLAEQLTSPFPSATDKARAIFTWLHYNIDYDVQGFFSGNLKRSSPASTLSSGLAVCEGYAGLFTAMASKVGLESVVVGGHGKGYGYTAVQAGEPVPPVSSNHAWNAVKIDNGEWKLIDACWGAGHCQGPGHPYVRRLATEFFTMDNQEFGQRHQPSNPTQFYRTDGRLSVPWEEYILGTDGTGEPVHAFVGCVSEHGLAPAKFIPAKKHIPVRGIPATSRVQFQFESICEHWDNEKMGKGKPYVFVLAVGGPDGRKREELPFLTNGGGHWWLDVPAGNLGCAGQTVTLFAVTSVGGVDGRGWTAEEFKLARRTGKGFASVGVVAWQLV